MWWINIHNIWSKRQNRAILIVFLRTENWTRYLVNCEAGLELQETVFKNPTIRGHTELLNAARLGYVTHLIIYLTLTWPPHSVNSMNCWPLMLPRWKYANTAKRGKVCPARAELLILSARYCALNCTQSWLFADKILFNTSKTDTWDDEKHRRRKQVVAHFVTLWGERNGRFRGYRDRASSSW